MRDETSNTSCIHCIPRVLVVEDELRVRGDHAENLKRWSYEPVVVQGQGQALLHNATCAARERRCHVALVDMRLLDNENRNDMTGLDLVSKLLPTLSIVVSGYGDMATTREALKHKGAFDFVGKQEGPHRLKEAIDSALRSVCACREGMMISWPTGLSSAAVVRLFFSDDSTVPTNEADDVLGRLFPHAHVLKLELIGGTSRTPSLAPRQRSLVLRVWEDDRQPVVVKLAPTPRLRVEVDRYREYIDGKLAGRFYARLQRDIMLWDLGGAIYEFLGASFEQMKLFAQFYVTEPPQQINTSLRRLFRIWAERYDKTRELSASSLFAMYSHVWGREWHERLRRFPDQSRYLRFPQPLDQLELPNPIAWVLKRVGLATGGSDASNLPNAYTAVTHGDLLGDNMFVDEARNVWMIDYERSGPGPILQDFVELEADILMRLAALPAEAMDACLALFLAIAQPKGLSQHLRSGAQNVEVAKAIRVIGGLRRLAYMHTRTSDMRQYLWGLLFNTVFRATIPHEGEQQHINRDRALLLGAVICCRLDQWDAIWPPPELLPFSLTPARTAEARPLTAALNASNPLRDQLLARLDDLAETIAHYHQLRQDLQRRLRDLERQQARMGISTPSHVTLDIEDIRRTVEQQERAIADLEAERRATQRDLKALDQE